MKEKVKKLVQTNYQQILFVFLAFLAMVLVSYVFVSQIVREQTFQIGEEIMNTTQTAVAAQLSETELAFSSVTYMVEEMIADGERNPDLQQFLIGITRHLRRENSLVPDFMKMYAYIDSEFLDGAKWEPPADYAPKSRLWYVGAVQNEGEIFFTEPYIDAQTGGVVISFSQIVTDSQGQERGVLAMDLNLNRITNYVRNQNLDNNGYGILLSDTLNFTAHRDESLIGVNIADAGGGYEHLEQMLKDHEQISAVRFTDVDGTDSIAFFRTLFKNGWHIGVITPRSSYYGPVHQLAAVLCGLGLILMSALSYLLVRTRVEMMRSDEESKSKSTFLARMSHEMRTPLNAIIGMTEIARRSQDRERIRYCLDKISDASGHLLGVINDILDMSKIEAGKLELSETDFVVKSMLDQVTGVMQLKISQKKQHLVVRLGEDVPQAIVADRQLLAQVLTNLLSNAVKFTMEKGTIELQIKRERTEDGYCSLSFAVRDSGIGISKEQQSRLFQAFEQADGSISRRFGGTGLGLSISKRIIDAMGGEITVESEPGKGSLFRFTVWVAIGQAVMTEDRNQPVSTEALFTGKRILMAEDVEINREILSGLLEGTGVEIDCAGNGREACEMFAEKGASYDLIFMDIHMPEMDGYEAAQKIREMKIPGARTIPIIAVTASVFREDIEKCLAAGMNGHVGKPLDVGEVIGQLKKYLLTASD